MEIKPTFRIMDHKSPFASDSWRLFEKYLAFVSSHKGVFLSELSASLNAVIGASKSYLEFVDLIMAANKYIFQSLTPEIAELSTRLSDEINADPTDRIIAATSMITNTPLITADKNLRLAKNISTIW